MYREISTLAERYGIHVKHYDGDTLIAIKPAGMLSTSRRNECAFQDYIGRVLCDTRYRLVHRVDRWTSGHILGAMTHKTRKEIKHQFINHKVSKIYLAVVDGFIPEGEYFEIIEPLFHDPKTKRTIIDENGYFAHTEGLSLGDYSNIAGTSLVLMRIHTGRTNQIRVHTLHYGYPLHGDCIYNPQAGKRNRQKLHGAGLRIWVPSSGGCKTIISVPDWIPKEMQRILNLEERLRRYLPKPTLKDAIEAEDLLIVS